MIANAGGESFAAKCAPDDPCFQRTKTPAELDTIIHVIDFGANWVAQMQVFRHESEEPTQSRDVAHVKCAEIERHKEHLVRVYYDRIGFAPSGGDPFAFR